MAALTGPSVTIAGGCLCAAIRYHVAGPPVSSILCHCQTCRKASAAPSVGWLTYARSEFKLLSGRPTSFSSSPGVIRTFCPACGSPLTYENETSPDLIDVTTVTLDDPSRFPPEREVWLEHKVGWQAVNSNLPRFPRGSGDGV